MALPCKLCIFFRKIVWSCFTKTITKQIFLSNLLICSLSVNNCPEWFPATLCHGHYEMHFVASAYLMKENTQSIKVIPRERNKMVLPGNISDSGRRQDTLEIGLDFSEVQSAGWAHGPFSKPMRLSSLEVKVHHLCISQRSTFSQGSALKFFHLFIYFCPFFLFQNIIHLCLRRPNHKTAGCKCMCRHRECITVLSVNRHFSMYILYDILLPVKTLVFSYQ